MGQKLDALRARAAAAPSQANSYQNFNYTDRLDNALYLADMRAYATERGITDKTDAELDQMLHDDSNMRELNTLGNFFGARGSQADLAKNSQGEDSLRRAARLQRAIEQAPTIFEEGGRSISEAAPSIGLAVATDPVNYAIAGAEALTGGAATPFVAGGRAALTGGRAALSGLARGAVQGAKYGVAEGLVTGAIADIGKQGVEQDLGISDGFSTSRMLQSTALSGAMSGLLGGAAGSLGGAVGGVRGGNQVRELIKQGYTPEEITPFLDSGATGLGQLAETTPTDYRAQLEAERVAAAANGQPQPSPIEVSERNLQQNREIRLASQQQALQQHLNEQTQKLQFLRADNEKGPDGVGVLDDQIAETSQIMANIKQAMVFPKSLENRQKIVDELLSDPDPKKRLQGRDLQIELFNDQAQFESIVGSDVPEDISSFINERLAAREQIDTARNIEAEAAGLETAAQKAALKERTKIVSADARTAAQAEGIVATDSGELAESTDAAMAGQARLTANPPSAADAQGIIDDAMEREAAELAEKQKAKADAAAAAAPQTPAAEPVAATPEQTALAEQVPAQVTPTEALAVETPAPVAKVEVPVTQSTRNTKVKASKAAKAKAIKVGVDLDEVKGSGKDGRVLGSDIQTHVEEKGASPKYEASLSFISDALENVSDQLSTMGMKQAQIATVLNDPTFVRRALKEMGGDALDDDAMNSLMDVFDSIRSNDGRGPNFNAPNFRSKTEQRFFHKRVAELVTSGQDEQTAQLVASLDVARNRNAPKPAQIDKTKVDPRMVGAASPSSTLGRMDNASPIPVNEAGRPLFRLQSLLKEGRKFVDAKGDEYSITSQVPNRATFRYEEARTSAEQAYEFQQRISRSKKPIDKVDQKKIESGKVAIIQPFIANGRTYAKDAKTAPVKGTVLYVSGANGKAYVDWRRAYAEAGLNLESETAQPPQLASLVANLRAGRGGVSPAAQNLNRTVALSMDGGNMQTVLSNEGLSFNDMLKALVEINGAAEIDASVPTAGLPALSQNGKRAFFTNKKTGEVRSPTDAQIGTKTARDIFGKSNPDDWSVEYHDMDVPRSKSALSAARATDAEKRVTNSVRSIMPKKAEELAGETMTIDSDPALAAAVDAVNVALGNLQDGGKVFGDWRKMSIKPSFTGRDISRLSDAIHHLPFDAVNAESVAVLRTLAELEDIVAPHGIRPPAYARSEAIDSINTVFAKLPSDIVDPMRDLVSRLANGEAPVVATTRQKNPAAQYDTEQGVIFFSQEIADGSVKTIAPQSHIFFHEVGHWAHFNLLTAKDRAEFWQWAADNLPDDKAAREKLNFQKGDKTADLYQQHYANPSEFFAESFAQWASGKIDSASNPAMWQRFSRYIKALFDAVLSRKPVDRDLEKLFLKILPDAEATRLADDLDAIENGLTPVEVELNGASPVQARGASKGAEAILDLDAGQPTVAAAQPDYMALSLDDLYEIGDDSRRSYIKVMKEASDQVANVQNLWSQALDTLDPDLAIRAYNETNTLLIGRVLDKNEKSRYLSSVAQAKGEKKQVQYAQSSDAFVPFKLSSHAILNRGKKMIRQLNRARAGKSEAPDATSQISFNSVLDSMSEAEAIETGLTSFTDPSKAAAALLDIVTNPGTGDVDGSLARLLTDMRSALNSAFENSGIIPQRAIGFGNSDEIAAYRTIPLGRFNEVGVGDVFVRMKTDTVAPADRGVKWTVRNVNNDHVVMVDPNGEARKVNGAAIETFRRLKSGEGKDQIEAVRAKRRQEATQLRNTLKRQRVEKARSMANAKIGSLPEPTLSASPTSVSAKALPDNKLLARVTSNTDVAAQAADEVVSRDLAKPYAIPGTVSSPLDEATAGLRNIRQKLLDGDASIDSDVAAQATVRPEKIALAPREPVVNLSIRREIAEGIGATTEAGIPASATPAMQDILSNIKHRNRRAEYTARTMTYRLLRMADPESVDLPDVAAFNPDGEEWRTLRGRIKNVAEQLSGHADPDATLLQLSRLIVDTSPDLASELSNRGYTSREAFDLLEAMLNPDTKTDIDVADRELASSLLDRAGYAVNGLIASERLRPTMARLTYFNDLFSKRGNPVSAEASPLTAMTLTDALAFNPTNLTPSKLGIDPSVMSRAGFTDLAIVSNGNIYQSAMDATPSFEELVRFSVGDEAKPAIAMAQHADRIKATLNSSDDPQVRESYRTTLDQLMLSLEESGVPVPRFDVVAIKAKTPFKLSAILNTDKQVANLRMGIEDALEEGDIPAAFADRVAEVMNEMNVGMTTADFYDALGRDAPGMATDSADPNIVLRALGYDSVQDKYGRIAQVLGEDQLRSVEDFMSPNLFSAPAIFDENAANSMGANITSAMLATAEDAKRFAAPPAREIARAADDQGIRSWVQNFGRNRALKQADELAPIRMRHKWFGTNAQRLRSGGFESVATWFENHFPAVQQDFARRLFGTKEAPGPLRAINALPDAPSKKRRWLAATVGKTIKPDSHQRILKSLWDPNNARKFAVLSDQERAALKTIRGSMNQVYKDLKTAGVMMGSRGENYFPQIWSQMAVRKDPAKAIDAFSQYFKIEAAKTGQKVDDVSARNRAQDIVAKLAEVDNESIWEPGYAAGNVAGAAENLDYSRRIELDKHPEALDALAPFLEQDLESYLVKYFDQSAHRLSLAKKFGHRNHAFGDYMTVTVKGRDGIAKLLSTRRTQEHNTFAITNEDGLVDVSVSETFPMPFEGREFEAIQAAQETMDIMANLGPNAARRHLMSLAVPDVTRGGKASTVYERRVDAIVDALTDHKGEAKTITTNDANYMNNVMKLAARRPLMDSNTVGVGATKALKAFNSVTLLSYTLLASFGDAFLPAVRSGDMGSALKGWGKYMRDPEYRDAMRSVGASIESILHSRLTYMTGTPANRLTSAFFNATGLTPWTDEMRSLATAVGFEALKTSQVKALRSYKAGIPIPQQSGEFKRNYRMLSRYGMQRFATDPTSISSKAVMESDQFRTGLMKFVDDAVFSPNPNDIPVWGQTPWGSVIFQLKSFPLMMQRMAKEVLLDDVKLAINEARGRPVDMSGRSGTGNLKRGMYMLSLMPLVGYGINSVQDVVRARGGEENNQRRPADRTLSDVMKQFPFFDEDYKQSFGILENVVDRETLDAVAGQYVSGFAAAAGFGLFASMLSDTASQAENGAYGAQRLASTVFGPSMGTFISGVNVAQGILDSNDASSYPERQAAREVFQRIPILGGQKGVRDAVVDSLPFNENAARAARVGGGRGGGGFGGGF